MARDHARINLEIWGDDDWRDLTPAAQHLYLLILTHPELSFAGVTDWRPGRLRALAASWTKEQFDQAANELALNLFIIVDEDTEEVMIRSFVKHDGLMKQRNMAVAMAKAYAAIASRHLRGALVHELCRLREAQPDLKWDGCESIMGNRSVDPADHPTGYPSVDPSSHPSVDPSVKGEPNPSVDPTPTPAPSPAPITPAPSPEREGRASATPPRTKGTRIEADWMPDQAVIDAMKTERPYVDLEAEHRKFVDHFLSAPGQRGVKVDWNATWRNWIRRAEDNAPAPPPRYSSPPSGNGYSASEWLQDDGGFVDAEVINIDQKGIA